MMMTMSYGWPVQAGSWYYYSVTRYGASGKEPVCDSQGNANWDQLHHVIKLNHVPLKLPEN